MLNYISKTASLMRDILNSVLSLQSCIRGQVRKHSIAMRSRCKRRKKRLRGERILMQFPLALREEKCLCRDRGLPSLSLSLSLSLIVIHIMQWYIKQHQKRKEKISLFTNHLSFSQSFLSCYEVVHSDLKPLPSWNPVYIELSVVLRFSLSLCMGNCRVVPIDQCPLSNVAPV